MSDEIRVTYDPSVDHAYVYLTKIAPGQVARTVDAGGDMTVMLDYDADGRLLGMEVAGASKRLPRALLGLATDGAREG